MKPRIAHEIPATREAIEKAFGQKIADRFVRNPLVAEYAAVLRFSDTHVIVSGDARRSLRKVATKGPVLIIARDMTLEARRVAAEAQCDVLTERENGWTDESYRQIRQW